MRPKCRFHPARREDRAVSNWRRRDIGRSGRSGRAGPRSRNHKPPCPRAGATRPGAEEAGPILHEVGVMFVGSRGTPRSHAAHRAAIGRRSASVEARCTRCPATGSRAPFPQEQGNSPSHPRRSRPCRGMLWQRSSASRPPLALDIAQGSPLRPVPAKDDWFEGASQARSL